MAGAWRLLGLLVIAIGVAVGCTASEASPEVPPGNPVLAEGREIYMRNCANCHGSAGGGGIGSQLNEGRVLERYPEIDEQIILVADGVRAMPGFGGKLTPAELDAVVRYTRDILAEG
ncbi:MAG: cytochrome c [Actinomycetota bacterium]